ncbi:MAG TPA: tetraacyldisaccharide 4'-kinase [Chthonomonadaceae bacterium]|nr:tetraacyldisaccharide 4'-kinase [Chthonomonadaceae bacterium]
MSAAEEYLLSVAHGRRGLVPALLRGGLSALAPVYCAGLKTYLLPYRLGLRKRARLPCPVISIGNLTTGGTGKTPMTQTLCRLLRERGLHVAVLSRGYGGRHEYGCAVVSDGQKTRLSAEEAGDEAYLLAKTLSGVPVVVGKDRRVTGALAWAQFQPDVLLLDDGLQFWQLHRDLDIVLLNACAPFDNGWTFPRGLLREPPSHLRRAGIVVLTNGKRAGPQQTQAVRDIAQRLAPGRPLFTADLEPVGLRAIAMRAEYPVCWLEGRRVSALSAVGNPDSFETRITESGGVLATRFRFRDHHAITLADLERVISESCAAGAEAVITTEKDAVKIAPLKSSLPLLALKVTMQVDGEAAFLAAVQEAIQHDGSHHA